MNRRFLKLNPLLITIALLAAILIIWLVFFKQKSTKQLIAKPVPVNITSVIQKDIPYVIELAGTAEASKTVELRSLITGQVMKVSCSDGQSVQMGDLLFEIDSRNLKFTLEQAQANLLRDQADLENAKKEAARYEALYTQKAASEEQYLQAKTNMETLIATTQADQAIIDNANLQIEYSQIAAPISGKLGEIAFDAGNIVTTTSATPMVVINKISPIYVSLFLPEQYLPLIRQFMDTDDLSINVKTTENETISGGKIFFY